MSRAYRIRVAEKVGRTVRGSDHISTQLELLEVLPREQMGEILAKELEGKGFQRKDCTNLERDEGDGVTTLIDLETGEVRVQSEREKHEVVEGSKEGHGDRDYGADNNSETTKKLRENLKKELEGKITEKEKQLQDEATNKLEEKLGSIRKELDEACSRTTSEALKQKAAQLGSIKEMSEDKEAGSLTIVLEV